MTITDVKCTNEFIQFKVDDEPATISREMLIDAGDLELYRLGKIKQLEKLKEVFYHTLDVEDDVERPFRLSFDDIAKIIDIVLDMEDEDEEQENR